MPRVAIVTDSTFDAPADWGGWERIHIIPIHIRFGEESFLEGIDLDEDSFYTRVDTEGLIPQTSQPNPSEFADFYHALSAEYDAIISMHVTARLSGTYQSAMNAADMVSEQIAVYPFDSAAGSAALGFMADEALDALDRGLSVNQVLQRLDYIRSQTNILLTPETLKYAHMSGRVSAMGSVVASLLNIEPIVVLREGELIADERVRTRNRALTRIIEIMQQRIGADLANIAIVHAQSPRTADTLKELVSQTFNTNKLWITSLATSIAVHLGPGTVGLVAYRI